MKKIILNDGQIFHGFEFKDLSEEIKEEVISKWIDFEIEVMDDSSPYFECALRMEKLKTPWFLAQEIYDKHKNDIVETIEINEFLFYRSGEIMPIVYHQKENKTYKITFDDTICQIVDFLQEYYKRGAEIWNYRDIIAKVNELKTCKPS